jgi:predicted Zn-dependent protease
MFLAKKGSTMTQTLITTPAHRSRPAVAPVLALALAVAFAATLAGCGSQVVNPVSGKTERSVMDEATEVAEGKKAHESVLAEYGVVADTQLQSYVNGVGQKLAKHSHRSNLVWTFTVLDSPEINAFALPGGFVYITRGIMAHLNDEADLAGVLGHEIGHVTARHGAQRATRQQNASVGVMAATVLGVLLEGAGVGGAAQAASQVSQGVAAGRLATYSRDQESQADLLGAEYLARNRYNPRNMVDVIAVLKAQERFAADQARADGKAAPAGGNWLASHPSNDQRLADITRVAAGYTTDASKLPAGGYEDDARGRYLKAIEGMAFGESREQGVTRGRNFFHEDLGIAITAPAGWKIQNTPEAITLVNGAGDAGLIVRVVPADAGATHEEIIRNVLKPTEGRTEKRSFNGLQATHFVGARRDAQGQTQAMRVSVVTGPANRNYLVQYAAKDAVAMQRASAQMVEGEASFRPLSTLERTAAKPYNLKSVVMPRGGFAELARGAPEPARAEAQLRLLNGVYGASNPADEPKVGSLVKVVQ